MVDSRVKVRICHGSPVSWLWLLLLVGCVPVSNEHRPTVSEKDRTCLQKKQVYDEGVNKCVPCGSCECGYIEENLHCVKCVGFGILSCTTPAEVNGDPQQETTPSPRTGMMTVKPTSIAETNKDDPTWKIVVGCVDLFLALLVVLAFCGLYMYKKRQCKKGLSQSTQETQPPEETHPMTSTIESSVSDTLTETSL